jgi:ubiquinone/menaquinone biosynthesis C-methylase UbiE
LLGAAALVVIFVGGWLASRRHTIPCPAWLSWLVEIDNPFFSSTRASTIITHLDLRPGMRALDVGCGPGRLTIPMARKVGPGGRVVALDIQAGMLRRAKAKAERAELANIDFHTIEVTKNKLHFGSFDRVVLAAVLGEIPDQETALRDIFDVLKPGGVLAVAEVIADPHFQRCGRVLALASRIGFCEKKRIGGRLAYSIYLERPASPSTMT